jgi:DNA-binding response OmpR family regulator
VNAVGTGQRALDEQLREPADAVVLDLRLPDIDGLDVCRRLREKGDRTPILMLTARDAVDERVAGLDAGADDYVVKPFALKELLARLRALPGAHRVHLVALEPEGALERLAHRAVVIDQEHPHRRSLAAAPEKLLNPLARRLGLWLSRWGRGPLRAAADVRQVRMRKMGVR